MAERPRLVGINHIALEVGDVDEAIAFLGGIFEVELRGRAPGMAFLDMGDQFLALSESEPGPEDRDRHFGLVVSDKRATRESLQRAGVEILPGRGLDFRDPWGNRFQVVDYREVQFSKAPAVLAGMGLEGLEKTPDAIRELEDKGLA